MDSVKGVPRLEDVLWQCGAVLHTACPSCGAPAGVWCRSMALCAKRLKAFRELLK